MAAGTEKQQGPRNGADILVETLMAFGVREPSRMPLQL